MPCKNNGRAFCNDDRNTSSWLARPPHTRSQWNCCSTSAADVQMMHLFSFTLRATFKLEFPPGTRRTPTKSFDDSIFVKRQSDVVLLTAAGDFWMLQAHSHANHHKMPRRARRYCVHCSHSRSPVSMRFKAAKAIFFKKKAMGA